MTCMNNVLESCHEHDNMQFKLWAPHRQQWVHGWFDWVNPSIQDSYWDYKSHAVLHDANRIKDFFASCINMQDILEHGSPNPELSYRMTKHVEEFHGMELHGPHDEHSMSSTVFKCIQDQIIVKCCKNTFLNAHGRQDIKITVYLARYLDVQHTGWLIMCDHARIISGLLEDHGIEHEFIESHDSIIVLANKHDLTAFVNIVPAYMLDRACWHDCQAIHAYIATCRSRLHHMSGQQTTRLGDAA